MSHITHWGYLLWFFACSLSLLYRYLFDGEGQWFFLCTIILFHLFKVIDAPREKMLINHLLPVSAKKLARDQLMSVFYKVALCQVVLLVLRFTISTDDEFLHVTTFRLELTHLNQLLLSWHVLLACGIVTGGLWTYRRLYRALGLAIILLLGFQLFNGLFRHNGLPTVFLMATLPIQAWVFQALDRHYLSGSEQWQI